MEVWSATITAIGVILGPIILYLVARSARRENNSQHGDTSFSISGLQADIAGVKADVADLKGDVREIKRVVDRSRDPLF